MALYYPSTLSKLLYEKEVSSKLLKEENLQLFKLSILNINNVVGSLQNKIKQKKGTIEKLPRILKSCRRLLIRRLIIATRYQK